MNLQEIEREAREEIEIEKAEKLKEKLKLSLEKIYKAKQVVKTLELEHQLLLEEESNN